MKWIVFWVLVTFVSLPYERKANEFGSTGSGIWVAEPAVLRVGTKRDTLQKEFDNADSAIAFMERARQMRRGINDFSFNDYIDTVWAEPLYTMNQSFDTLSFHKLTYDNTVRARIDNDKPKTIIILAMDTVIIEGCKPVIIIK